MNDVVKHKSSGYANFNYSERGYQVADLVKVSAGLALHTIHIYLFYLLIIFIPVKCDMT